MAEQDGPTDWTSVNFALDKRRRDTELPLHPDQPMHLPAGLQAADHAPAPAGETAPDAVANPEGIIARFKVGAVTRKAAIQMAQLWYGKQLEAMEHRLGEVVRVRNAEATTVAEQMLASINDQHLRFLVELGLRHEKQRGEALHALVEQTSALLRDGQARDWPPTLREQYVHGVMQRHDGFFRKLVDELGA